MTTKLPWILQIDWIMSFPIERPRRLRRNATLRRMVRETTLNNSDLVQPLFVVPGESIRQAITTLPGQYHLSVDQVVEEASRLADTGIPAVILFGIPATKDARGSSGWDMGGEVGEI